MSIWRELLIMIVRYLMTNATYKSLVEVIKTRAEQEPKAHTYIFLSKTGSAEYVSNERLYVDSLGCANRLLSLGIKPGDLIILIFQHSYELVATFWGAICAGAVPSVFPYFTPQSTPEVYKGQVQNLVRFTGAKAIITIPEFKADLRALFADTDCKVLEIHDIKSDKAGHDVGPDISPKGEDAAYIQFSSGTTDLPKGVILSHQVVLNHAESLSESLPFTKTDVNVSWLPFFHDMGLVTGLFLPLIVGACSVFISPENWVRRPKLLFQAIHKYKGTMTWMPNFAFNHCVRGVRDRDLAGLDLSSWRILGNGSELVQYDSLQMFAERFSAYGFRPRALMPGYGMAENVLAISLTPSDRESDSEWISVHDLQESRCAVRTEPHTPGARQIVSCGYPISNTEIAIADEKGNFLPDRYVGEVMIRSNSMFTGYYGRPDLTELAFRDGWFHTGDMGYVAEGQIYICDRKKDLIIVGGKNIYPHDIEAIAKTILDTNAGQVAAFGVQDKELGTESAVLVCELRGNPDASERDELTRQIHKQVLEAFNADLADVRFVPKRWVLKTTSGKTARAASQQKYVSEFLKTAPQSVKEHLVKDNGTILSKEKLERQLVRIFEEISGIRPVGVQDNLFDFGIDSLTFMRLFSRIEKEVGEKLPMADVLRIPTIEHIAEIIIRRDGLPHPSPGQNTWKALKKKQGFKETLRKIRGNILPIVAAVVPYSAGAKFLSWFCGQRWIQTVLFRKQAYLIQQCLADVGNSTNEADVISHSLTSNFCRNWRLAALAHCSPEQFDRWITIIGLSKFQHSYRQGRGIILVSCHSVLLPLMPLLADRRMGHNNFSTIGGKHRRLALMRLNHLSQKFMLDMELQVSRKAFLTSQLYSGKQTLENGGIVLIASDGHGGDNIVNLPFYGRCRPFRTGFAELAVRTGADVMPVFVSMDISGHVKTEFFQPFNVIGVGHQEQVGSLVRQYAKFLERIWAEDIGNIQWQHLRKFLALPRAETQSR